MENATNIWTILFLIVGGQGLFISLFLFLKSSYLKKSNVFLASLLFLFSLNLAENVIYWTGYLHRVPHLANTTLGFIYLYGPFFYLFVVFRVTPGRRLKILDVLHLLPFALFSYRMLGFFSLNGEIKRQFISQQDLYVVDFWTYFWQIASSSLLIAYLVVTFRSVNGNKMMTKTLRNVLLLFSLFAFSMLCYFISSILMNLDARFDYILMLIISMFVYLIGYNALAYPSVFDPALRKVKSRTKYARSSLSYEESKRHIERFKELMDNDQLYLKKNLKISEVAEKLSISVNHLSQALNAHGKMTFLETVNYYRVEEAKKKLLMKDFENYTIEGVASEVGFTNRTSFIKYFKKFTKMTPREFKMMKP